MRKGTSRCSLGTRALAPPLLIARNPGRFLCDVSPRLLLSASFERNPPPGPNKAIPRRGIRASHLASPLRGATSLYTECDESLGIRSCCNSFLAPQKEQIVVELMSLVRAFDLVEGNWERGRGTFSGIKYVYWVSENYG